MNGFRKKQRLKPTTPQLIEQIQAPNGPREQLQCAPLTADVVSNEQILREIFRDCSDVVFRSIRIDGQIQSLLVYVDGLVDSKQLDDGILKPLMHKGLPADWDNLNGMGRVIEEQMVAAGQTKIATNVSDIVQHVLAGDVAVLVDGESNALLASIKGWKMRSVEEPGAESTIRGPREGFTENIRTNTSLLRRKLRTPRLKMELLMIGELSRTDVVIAYVDGIATPSVVEEVRKRVGRIQIDGVLESGYIEEFIEDFPYSPFPQIQNTERPDIAAANLLEGKVAILTDGTPFVLIVPLTFWGAMQAGDDYYERFLIGTAIRWIRFIFLFIALLFPSLYVAVTTFHQEMVPTNLLLSIIAAREASPFPALIEALIMEITFEALREAGLRLPRQVGQAVSIVGALVIGQAAVQAGIISAPMVIVVSITGVASFAIPRYNFAIGIRMLRFPMIFLAGTVGIYGITIGLLVILVHLASLRSFGIPYFTPLAPLTVGNLKDVFIRVPWWDMNLRPRLTGYKQPQRVPEGQKPSPMRGKDGTEGS